jgi:hypothetical protein
MLDVELKSIELVELFVDFVSSPRAIHPETLESS